jgi:saccharopine dehydrogenase (NAD+, L-lysine-forming)
MASTAQPKLWLRCEKKEFEQRAALTPTTSKKLIDAGFEIFVERDQQRVFDDEEYEKCVFLPVSGQACNPAFGRSAQN